MPIPSFLIMLLPLINKTFSVRYTYFAPSTLGGGGLEVSSAVEVSIGSSPCLAFLFGGLLIATLTVWSPI